jgi:prepilin-type N-terminal cleavage/methylation domain-containing protein
MKGDILSRKAQGFTLIETLVSIVILGVLTAITAPSFLGWLNAKRVDDAVIKADGAFKEARSSAIKKNRSCTLKVTAQAVSAVRIDSVSGTTSEDHACLPSGDRILPSNTNVEFSGTGGSSGTLITFSLKGSVPITQTTEAILVRRTDTTGNQKIKCLVISSGLGIVRTGTYLETTIPTIAELPAKPVPVDPNNTTAVEQTAIGSWTDAKNTRDLEVQATADKCISPT